MTRSFRLGSDLEADLARAARAEGVPVSRFIRRAVRDRCAQVLDRTLKEDLADVIGIVAAVDAGTGVTESAQTSVAERTGEAFTELLLARARGARPARPARPARR